MTENSTPEYDKLVVLEIPIYDIEFLNGFLLVAGAGGGKKYGVRNYFMSYKVKNAQICKQPAFQIEFVSEIPYHIKSIPRLNMCVLTLSDSIKIYSMDMNNGELKEINTIKLLDFSTSDIYLTTFSLDDRMELAACGDTQGCIKLLKVNSDLLSKKPQTNEALVYSKSSFDLSPINSSSSIHRDKINEILILNRRGLIISVSMDATCKITDYKTFKVLKELSFKTGLTETNLIMRSINYNSYDGIITTLQSPMRGDSYMTKWQTSNFEPIMTEKICNSSCTVMKKIGDTFIVGETSGSVIHIDANTLSINEKKEFHVLATKSITSVGKNYFFTSSPDQMITVHSVKQANLISFYGVIKMLLISFFMYVLKIRFDLLRVETK